MLAASGFIIYHQAGTYIRDSESAQDLARLKIPKTQSIGVANTQRWLQDSNRLDKVRCQNVSSVPVNAETVGRKLISENIQQTINILRPFMDDIEVLVGLNQTARSGSHSRAHVCDEVSTVRLCANLVSNRGKDTTVALQELGAVRIRGIEVEAGVLF